MADALIIFSRLPIGHETKTRLATILSETQRKGLHLAMWQDIFREAMKLSASTDIFLYWTGNGNISDYREHIPPSFILREQHGENLGSRMRNAMRDIFSSGYGRAVLIGSDIPTVKAENISRSFAALNNADVVLGASGDGGYWLIGMKKFIPAAFGIPSWGNSSVLNATTENLKRSGFTCVISDEIDDIDTPEDIKNFMNEDSNEAVMTYTFLSKNIKKQH